MWSREPDCPVEGEPKEWLENNMSLLGKLFGLSDMRARPVILPTDQFFPMQFDGSEQSAKECYALVCEYMGINPANADLQFYSDEPPPRVTPAFEWSQDGAAGFYEDGEVPTIAVGSQALADPMSLVATIAHELGHLLLHNRPDVDPDHEDHEPLTDLLTVFYGLGIFGANSSIKFRQYEYEIGYDGYEWRNQGYLDYPEWGYAHALLAHGRGEAKPEWIKHLRPDLQKACKQGLKYIQKTGDCAFQPV